MHTDLLHTRKLRTAVLCGFTLALLSVPILARRLGHPDATTSLEPIAKDDAQARSAFLAAVPVFRHPRCLNCHSTGDYPRQGDDGHIHIQNVRRGPKGLGLYAQKCSSCHQQQNTAGLNMPPGAPGWHLPPPATPMIWEGKTPAQICSQLKDPKQNGGLSIAGIVEHVTHAKLVLWGWEPGDGRTTPPLSHAEFAQKMSEWARAGAACPAAEF